MCPIKFVVQYLRRLAKRNPFAILIYLKLWFTWNGVMHSHC